MNILTLSIKQIYFDEILAGKKTHEYREIRPTNAKKYITYLCGGKEYKADEELPEEGEIELKPIKYDAIKFLTGEYKGKRPYAIVEVKGAEASILTDEDGNDIVYEHQGEELPDIYVIAAGSLLENLIDVRVSFPVGRVQYMALRPCSFREFLGAVGEEPLLSVLDKPEITLAFHDRLMLLFNIYTLIGGMPEVVQLYAERRDILSLESTYETLLQGYRDDVEKYALGKQLPEVIRFILKEGWHKAGQIITLGGFAGSSYNAREVGEAFRLLEKAMLLELVYPTTATEVPATPEIKRMPKLVWLDTGLVNYAAQVQKEVLGAKDIMDAWRGMIAEQIVAQELLTLTDKVSQKRCFWVRNKSGSNAEVDYVWVQDSMVYPIEVKSGHNAHLRSLHSFMNHSNQTVAVRIWSQPYAVDEVKTADGKEFKLINLPFYLVGKLDSILRRF